MKALTFLTNVERAKIIHELFPQEMLHLISFSVGMAEHVLEAEEELTASWDNQLISAKYWIYLVKKAKAIIEGKELILSKNKKLFSDLLFADYTVLFMADCIGKYAEFTSNAKFKIAAQLFFEFTPEQKNYVQVVYHACLSYTADYLFEAINEAMAQEEKAGISAAAKQHISHEALAKLAAQIAIQTDHIDNGGYWLDREGKYIIKFHH